MKSQNFVLLKFYGKKSMSREKWLSTIEIAIPEVPSEVKVKIPESVFALFNPRINGKTVILGYGPVEPYSPIVE